MIRKLALAVAAVAALGTATLAVTATPAEAKKGWHKHHHHHHGFWRGGFRVYAGDYGYYDGCLKRVWVINRFGETELRAYNVCY
jgi:hypothetical protein